MSVGAGMNIIVSDPHLRPPTSLPIVIGVLQHITFDDSQHLTKIIVLSQHADVPVQFGRQRWIRVYFLCLLSSAKKFLSYELPVKRK
jgi:hypothetical protein